MPLLPLRDVVVFNYMIVPLFVGREQPAQGRGSRRDGRTRYFPLRPKRRAGGQSQAWTDLYPVGSVALILRLLKMPDGRK